MMSKMSVAGFFVFASLVSFNTFAKNLCEPSGVEISFFNGVDNEVEEAVSSMFIIKEFSTESFGSDYLDERNVGFSFFYNNTEGRYDDIQEVFSQRDVEFINSYYEMSVAIKTGNKKRLKQLAGIYPESENQINDLTKKLNERLSSLAIKRAVMEETEEVYDRHKKQIDEFESENKRLILIGHSQGNFFMNAAYDYALKKIRKSDIRAVHIAPASQTLRGNYVLSSYDFIIEALRFAYGESAVPDINIDIPFHYGDISGHKFMATYMNNEYQGKNIIMGEIYKCLVDLYYKLNNEYGFFSISLESPENSNIILFVDELNNDNNANHIYVNAEDEYYSPCDSEKLVGKYNISYSNYGESGLTNAKLVLHNRKGVVIASKDIVVEPYNKDTGEHPVISAGSVLVEMTDDGLLDIKMN